MSQFFTPGQTVYLLYWRRPEESKFTRVAFYLTKRGRDNANIDTLSWGLVTMTASMEIPTPVRGHLKEVKQVSSCPKCGAPMTHLSYGEGKSELICPNACDCTLDEVLEQAEEKARQELGDNDQYV